MALIVHTWSVLKRFKANQPGPFPRRVWFNTTVTVLVLLALMANSAGFPIKPGLGPVAVAVTWRLIMGVEIFMLTLEEFLEKPV